VKQAKLHSTYNPAAISIKLEHSSTVLLVPSPELHLPTSQFVVVSVCHTVFRKKHLISEETLKKNSTYFEIIHIKKDKTEVVTMQNDFQQSPRLALL
jgi:hypothetical protein